MIVRALAIAFCVAVVTLGGAATNDDLPPQFRFISRVTTLQEVVDHLGPYSQVRGSRVQAFEFDLPDGSAVLVFPDHPYAPYSRIIKVQFYPKKEQIDAHR